MGDTIYTYADDFSEGRDYLEEGGGYAGEGDFGEVKGGGGVIPAEVFHGDIVASQSLRRYIIGAANQACLKLSRERMHSFQWLQQFWFYFLNHLPLNRLDSFRRSHL